MTPLPVEESTTFLGLCWICTFFKKHISALKTQCKKALNIIRVVAHLKQRSSTVISRMVRWLAASCPKDSQITVPSLLLRQQPSHWHWTIISHGSWTARCHSLLWLNALLAGNWGRRYLQPSHLPDHESPLGIERQRYSSSLLLGAKPLWHRGERDSGPVSKGDTWPRHRPTNDCPLCRFDATGKFLHSTGGLN